MVDAVEGDHNRVVPAYKPKWNATLHGWQ
jgi:hypothetical protein